MRFACLHHGDPFSESLWSGIPLNIVRTLQSLGHEVLPVGPLHPNAPLVGRLKTQIYRRLFHKQYLMNRDPAVVKLRAKDGNRLLQCLGPVDAVLVTYPPNASFIQTTDPVVIIHDATWTQLLDFYPGHERKTLAAETIRGGVILDRLALDRCDYAIYSSDWAANGAITEFGLPETKVSVASLGANIKNAPSRADIPSFLEQRGSRPTASPGPTRSSTQSPMKLLFVGKEWYRKGGDIAVLIGSEIESNGIPVELHVVGCEPEGHVPAFVQRHGWLRKDVPEEVKKLRDLYESSDFFIMPTRADATPVVYAEAAAYALPVIGTDVGGVKDVIGSEWGIALPLGSSPALYAQWAISLYTNRSEYERVSTLARDAYEEKLNWTAFCHHLIQVVAHASAAKSNRLTGHSPANK